MQTTELKLENTESAQYLKIVLEEGSGLFAAVYSVTFLDIYSSLPRANISTYVLQNIYSSTKS